MNKNYSPQRKTTLKWNPNGELTEIDMLRILEKISADKLNKCELSCHVNSKNYSQKFKL